jgi:hypothetical protein
LWQLWITLHCTLVRLHPSFSPNPLLITLKQLQKHSSFCFLQVHEAHQLYFLIFISSIQPSFLQTPSSSIPILQSSFSLSTTKSMFKGISQCIGAMKMLYFGQLKSLYYLPLSLPSATYYPAVFSTFCYVPYLCRCEVFWYCWLLVSFLTPSPWVPYVFPLLPTFSTCTCVFDHFWFCVYIYFWIYLPNMRENMKLLSFLTFLLHLTRCPTIVIDK